jgi:hypothetical protein
MSDAIEKRESRVAEFLASHGGPFYELQLRLGLLHRHTLLVGRRAVVFVALAWGVPLLLGLPESVAIHGVEPTPYILHIGAWAKFFIAIGCFVIAEQPVEEQLRVKLAQFLRAPLIAPGSWAAAAAAVATALRRRDSRAAEIACLALAVSASIAVFVNLRGADSSTWAVRASPEGGRLTAAGWWSLLVSRPLFWFLFIRGLWRHLVWALLLRRLARLELRLVATHPDGNGGLAFIAGYPNSYATFVFGASSVVAAALAHSLMTENLTSTVFGCVAGGWLAIVLALFALPLSAFTPPLRKLKESTTLSYGARATQYQRLSERKLLGGNIAANDPAEAEKEAEVADPGKQFDTSRKLSTMLMSRTAVVPVAVAALIPFAIAGATELPYKEVLEVVKKLILL